MEKNISLRLPEKVLSLLKSLAGDKQNISEVVREQIDAGLNRRSSELELKKEVYALNENIHDSMSRILEKFYDNPSFINKAEVVLLCQMLQKEAYGQHLSISTERYVDLIHLTKNLYEFMSKNGMVVDEHYLTNKLRMRTYSDITGSLNDREESAIKNNITSDIDGLSRSLECLIDGSWQIDEIAFHSITSPYLETLVILGTKNVFKNKPYIIPSSRSSFLAIPVSAHRSHKDFKVTVYDNQHLGFVCIIETPYVLLTTDYRAYAHVVDPSA